MSFYGILTVLQIHDYIIRDTMVLIIYFSREETTAAKRNAGKKSKC
jgi:hypothetical protein